MAVNGLSSIGRLLPRQLAQISWLRPRYPLTAVELREDAVLVSRLKRQRGGYRLAGHGRGALSDGVFSTSMVSPRIGDAPALARVVNETLTEAGAEKSGKVSLALPDTVARVSLLDFQDLPPTREQLADLIRWRLKKTVPFALEDAQISWEELGRAEDGRVQMLVAVAPRGGLRDLERVFEALGIRVGVVDLASLNVLNALRRLESFTRSAGGPSVRRDRALLSATPNYFSLMILRNERLIFYRAKNYHVQGQYRGEDSALVVGRELRTTLSYYEEHLLGEGIGTMFLHVVGIAPDGILDIANSIGCEDVRQLEVGSLLPELATMREAAASELLPSIGLALRREP